MGKKRSGQAKNEETGLWDRVKRSVDPLDAKQRARYSQALADYLESGALPIADTAPTTPPPKVAPAPKPAVRKPAPVKPATDASPLVDLDRKTRSRIARGRTPIDARLDLHGLRQHEAMDVLRAFIWRSHSSGHRTVLVITGKGSRVKDPHPDAPPWAVGSGILRRAVPGWLAAPDMRAAVLSVETASLAHGGEGALYVRLRAKRAR